MTEDQQGATQERPSDEAGCPGFSDRTQKDTSRQGNRKADRREFIKSMGCGLGGALKDYTLVACVGHDEYPPPAQYDAYEAARDSGTNLMFIGGNLWPTKTPYRERDRTIIKEGGWHEARVTGLEFGPGTSLWKLADLTVVDPSHRWFEGTGFTEGDQVIGVSRSITRATLPRPGSSKFPRSTLEGDAHASAFHRSCLHHRCGAGPGHRPRGHAPRPHL